MDDLDLTRPRSLSQIGFRSCDHPLKEHFAVVGAPGSVARCLTCGACSPSWERVDVRFPIDYRALEQHRLVDGFGFWLRQRPESRTFGDI